MDWKATDEYWLSEFVREDDDWLSKYLQDGQYSVKVGDINLTNEYGNAEGLDGILEYSALLENAVSADASNIAPLSSCAPKAECTSPTQQNPKRIPFNKRWELLRPEIEQLYIDEKVRLCDIIRIMREKFDFDAA